MTTGAMVMDLGRDGEMPEWFSLVAFGTRWRERKSCAGYRASTPE
jgi:hypothetical protein